MRLPVGSGSSSIVLVDTGGKRKGFSVQNVGGVDVFYSDDQRTLDGVDQANNTNNGHILPANQSIPLVYPIFIGKLFIRTSGPQGVVDVIIYEVDPPC